MGDLTRAPARVRFGVFELDLIAGELRKSGVRIRLNEQPYRVLALLLGRAGEVVTREDLRKALWPDETFVDFDHGLNSAVNKLRENLGDSASHPKYIETVPRRGYRFVAPIQTVQDSANDQAVADNPSPQPRPARRRWHWGVAAALAAAALAAAALAAYALHSRFAVPLPRIMALTSYPGFEVLPAFSPDGSQVAFVWGGEREDNYDIYVKVVGTERALRLTRDAAVDTNPVWSQDGSAIAFLRVRLPDRLDVLLMSPLGDAERKVGELRNPGMVDPISRPGASDTLKRRRISWMPNGEWLVVQDRPNQKEPSALFLLSVRTGEKRRLTLPPADSGGDRSPAVSRDGRRIAFVRSSAGVGGQIHVLEVDKSLAAKSNPVRLTSERWVCTDPTWMPDGEEVVFSAGGMHNPGLWRVRVNGSGTPRRIYEAGDRDLQPVAVGSRLAYAQFTQDVNIWRVEDPLASAGEPHAERFIASTVLDHMPRYSPDGSRVAFISNRTGVQEIWLSRHDGSNLARLTFFGDREVMDLNWSTDGKQIGFQLNSGNDAETYSIGVDGGEPRPLGYPRGVTLPVWSRDGAWIYFGFVRNGEQQVFRIPKGAADSDPVRWTQVTQSGGTLPTESVDGRFLYYVKGNDLWRRALAGGREDLLVDSLSYPVNFAVVRRGVFFIPFTPPGQRGSLQFLDIDSGQTRVVHTFDRPVMWGLSATLDGGSVLYTRLDNSGSDLKLLENPR